jgi:hypothetical protein
VSRSIAARKKIDSLGKVDVPADGAVTGFPRSPQGTFTTHPDGEAP